MYEKRRERAKRENPGEKRKQSARCPWVMGRWGVKGEAIGGGGSGM